MSATATVGMIRRSGAKAAMMQLEMVKLIVFFFRFLNRLWLTLLVWSCGGHCRKTLSSNTNDAFPGLFPQSWSPKETCGTAAPGCGEASPSLERVHPVH